VADRVHTGMDAVQAPALDAAVDLTWPQAAGEQLRA
jgi:hypothetical protein